MVERLSPSELVTVPGVGHTPLLTEPEALAGIGRLLDGWRVGPILFLPCKGRCPAKRGRRGVPGGDFGPTSQTVTPLRQAFALPPPLAGEENGAGGFQRVPAR